MSVITEDNLLSTVIHHDQTLTKIAERHKSEDEEEQRREKWRGDMMKLLLGVLTLVGGEMAIRLFGWVQAWIHIGRTP